MRGVLDFYPGVGTSPADWEAHFLLSAAALVALPWDLRALTICELFVNHALPTLASGDWPQLNTLFLSLPCGAGVQTTNQEQLESLALASWGANVRTATLALNLDAPALAALATLDWPRLENLTLLNNSMDAQGAAGLALAKLPSLRSFTFTGNTPLPVGAARALAGAYFVSSLQSLSLTRSSLCYAGVAALLSAAWPSLVSLDLSHNRLQGAAALAAANVPRLTHLNLAGNEIMYYGALALTKASWPDLQSIDLSTPDEYGYELAAALASGRLPSLVSLRLLGRDLGHRGVLALLQARWPNLASLELSEWNLSMKNATLLRRRWPGLTLPGLAPPAVVRCLALAAPPTHSPVSAVIHALN